MRIVSTSSAESLGAALAPGEAYVLAFTFTVYRADDATVTLHLRACHQGTCALPKAAITSATMAAKGGNISFAPNPSEWAQSANLLSKIVEGRIEQRLAIAKVQNDCALARCVASSIAFEIRLGFAAGTVLSPDSHIQLDLGETVPS